MSGKPINEDGMMGKPAANLMAEMWGSAEREVAELRAALNKYGDHLYECDLKNDGPCTCGFEAALSNGELEKK
jgi:hypothetical protein